jgi:hypothetical protein
MQHRHALSCLQQRLPALRVTACSQLQYSCPRDASKALLLPFKTVNIHMHTAMLPLQSSSLGVVAPPPGLTKRHLPKHVSWRGTPADNVVKDQATCGSCWVRPSSAAAAAAGRLNSACVFQCLQGICVVRAWF